jgi:hypothetical protein
MRLIAMDSLKMSPPAPSMIDARDAILLAERTTFAGASQDRIWAAFARRGFGILAQSASADSVHIVSSAETPSNTGTLRFYEDSYSIGETVRILLHDANLTTPTVGIQLTSSSGDLENIVLRRRGSVYCGEIPTEYAPVFRGDASLNIVPGDAMSAYYVDANTGSGSRLIETTVPTKPDYALEIEDPRPNQFPGETRLGLRVALGSVLRALPFEFPFFGRSYSAIYVYNNGILTFDLPDFSPCTDLASLRLLTAIAPMWMNLATNGSAQSNEDVYVSQTADTVTFRWVAETSADVELPGVTAAPQPVNFSATLHRNGNIEFRYGSGNRALVSGSQFFDCPVSGATVGISNGHDSFVQPVFTHDSQNNLENAPTVIFQSPDTPIGGPQPILESPVAGDTLRSLISGRGIVFDPEPDVFIRRVDVISDGVARVPATLGAPRTDFCRNQNVPGCPNVGFTFSVGPSIQGIAPGPHTLQLRATNSRGVIAVFPDTPLTFNLEAGAVSGIVARLEAPTDGMEVSGRVPVTGYFGLPDARVMGVDVIVDGITYGAATYGLLRNDVCTGIMPAILDCPRIGFSFMLNTTAQNPTGDILMSAGNHALQLRGRDSNGRLFLFPDNPLTIRVNNPVNRAPNVVITVPKANDYAVGRMSIMGHAFDVDGRVVSVAIAIDGITYTLPVNYGSPRPEACAALTDVTACPNIGFEVEFDTRRLSNGPHLVRVSAIDDKGAIGYAPSFLGGVNFIVQNQ